MEPQVLPQTILPALAKIYAARTDWGIDAIAGNDRNTGKNIPGQRLKTHAELEKRLTGLTLNPPAPSLVTIHVVTDLPATDPTNLSNVALGPNVLGLLYQGTATTVFSGTATGVTVKSESTNQPFEFADALLPDLWSAHFTQRIRLTSGGFSGFSAWVAKDLGAGNARVSSWASPIFTTTYQQDINTTTVGPAPGDTYVLESLSKITLGSLDVRYLGQDGTLSIMFVDFQVLAPTSGGFNFNSLTPQQRLFVQCCMGGFGDNRDFEWDSAAQEVGQANCVVLTGNRFRYGTSHIVGGLTHNDGSSLILGRWIFLNHCNASFDADILFQGDAASVGSPIRIVFGCNADIGSIGFFDYANAELIQLLSRSFLQFRSSGLYDTFGIGTSTVWGSCATGTVLALDSGVWAGGNFLFESWFIGGGITNFTMGYNDFVDNHDGRALNWGTFFGASVGAVAGDGTYSIAEFPMTAANLFIAISAGGFLNDQRAFGPFTVDEGKIANLQGECAFVYRDLHF